jgi:flavin reductase (DIM6/NTAB) family NADH-FMN oxidoreductase RutF
MVWSIMARWRLRRCAAPEPRMKKNLPLEEVYTLIEPGPVLLLTTAAKGHVNVMTQTWHTMMDFTPPLIGCVISGRDYSHELLRASKECVLNIPSVALIEQTVKCGNISGRDFDKFAAYGLTKAPAELVAAPLIKECIASLECKLVDTHMAAKYDFFVLEVVKAWVDARHRHDPTFHHRGKGTFVIDGEAITLPSNML